MIKAEDCKCCKCGKQAVAFWPVCDPDIKDYPYCRKCLDAAKMRVIKMICESDYNSKMRELDDEQSDS